MGTVIADRESLRQPVTVHGDGRGPGNSCVICLGISFSSESHRSVTALSLSLSVDPHFSFHFTEQARMRRSGGRASFTLGCMLCICPHLADTLSLSSNVY